MFQWLEDEIALIKTRNFHVVNKVPNDNEQKTAGVSKLHVPDSYKAFVARFGNCKLYRQSFGYELGVRACPTRMKLRGVSDLLCFGHFRQSLAYFRESLLNKGKETTIFENHGSRLIEICDNFPAWIEKRASDIKKTIGKRRWKTIVGGPKPFTDNEKRIVEQRKFFDWTVDGIDGEGNFTFIVENASEITLPFLTICARDKNGSFEGKIWLNTSGIGPHSTGKVIRTCYKEILVPEQVELFDAPCPGPEEREDYWEFRDNSS